MTEGLIGTSACTSVKESLNAELSAALGLCVDDFALDPALGLQRTSQVQDRAVAASIMTALRATEGFTNIAARLGGGGACLLCS
jgi:hypothetical protein